MANKIRIKDVAQLSGVSAGTVDRVIHNRGNVSETSRIAVEKALTNVNYKTNIHVSAISLKKKYNVVITIPGYTQGEYWELINNGINMAINKYSGLDITCEYLYYNQFDLFSCRNAFNQVLDQNPDAVIIGPTFRDEAIALAEKLASCEIPFVFVDSTIEGTTPLAYFTADPYSIGYLMARLITNIIDKSDEIAIMQAVRTGDESANTTIIRKSGFMQYCKDKELTNTLHRVPYSATDTDLNNKLIGDFFEQNPKVKGAVVLNSRGHVIADYITNRNISGVKVVGVDVLEKNIKAVLDGKIEYLIGQRPNQQGFMAMKTIFGHLVYRKPVTVKNLMPIDIITKENAEVHAEASEMSLFD